MRVPHVRTVFATLVLAVAALGCTAGNAAAVGISVTPITWDVVGLDSNSPATGPNVFPVGARVCNTSGATRTNVTSTWTWDTANANVTLQNLSTQSLGTLAAAACVDTYYNVVINPIAAAQNTARGYHISVTSTEGSSGQTPAGRQIYVEKLVSQNRNSTKKISGPGGCNLTYTVCDPADTNLRVGNTYTYNVYGETASNYEQLEVFINFPNTIFRVNSASATYENPAGGTGTSPYADACGWQPDPALANYKKCVGPANFTGGKVGGRVVVTYSVTVERAAPGFLQSLFYDFSGSSYHYNSDFTDSSLGLTFESFWPLTVGVTGTGTVTSNVGGINCGVACEGLYQDNQLVTLTAAPGPGQSFTGWGGACSGTATTCQVTMTQSRSVTATFAPVVMRTLTANVTGSGSISSSPSGISCGADCSESYINGTPVTLTATPGVGQVFAGWTGCTPVVGFPTMCTLTMDADKSVTAQFAPVPTYTLSVSLAGTGTGSVASTPGGISCGADCSEAYTDGTVVTLDATPDAGQEFLGWSGACTGTDPCVVTMTGARSVTATFAPLPDNQLDVVVTGSGTVTSSPSGISCGADCTETYAPTTSVTLTATPQPGHVFIGWNGDCSGSATTCIVPMDQPRLVDAQFAPITHPLSASVAGLGSVTSSPAGVSCGADCAESYDDGTVVTLTATPDPGQEFVGWSGDCSGSLLTCDVTISAARSVTATFQAIPPVTHTLTVDVTGSGSVTSAPTGITCGADCAEDYTDGTVVTLTATPGADQEFLGWGGDCSGTSATCDVTTDQARSVTATFGQITHTLDVSVVGAGAVTSSPAGIDCGVDCTEDYDQPTVVTLTATSDPGQEFVGWTGDCSGSLSTCDVTMDQARSVTATFQAIPPVLYTLDVSVVGSGSVTSSPSGIDCGLDCSEDYVENTVVTLTATPDSGQEFVGWTGDCSGSLSTCDVTMDQARSVTATFQAIPPVLYTLDASVVGSGSVTSSPAGIDCGLDCTEDYVENTIVTLTATPALGQVFVGWTGCTPVVGFPDMCTVTMDAGHSVVATFAAAPPVTHALDVSLVGSGSVTSGPSGIDCGVDCAEDYTDGTVVTLTATPDSGQEFVGWTGDCSGSLSTCDVTMDQARSVTATFQAIPPVLHTLDVSVVGSGSVTSAPSGIDCGVDCSEDYTDGTVVTLTATPASGQQFTGWSGACSGTNTTCDVTIDQARSVTATFAPITHPLTVSVTGSGSVTSSPAGIDCGVDCAQDYDQPTVVTLTATPASGQQFTGWSGDCSGASTTCDVTMSQARSVSATFAAIPPVTYALATTVVGSGSITSSPSGIDCGSDCAEIYTAGAVVTLTATPASGQDFAGWSGACTGTATCVVTMSQARSVTATFQATPVTTPLVTPPPATPPVASPPPATPPPATPPPVTPPAKPAAKDPTLSLTLTPSAETVPGGDVLNVRIDPRNLGPVDALDVVVCAPIPDGFSLISAPGGTLKNGQVCWKVGTLVKGATPTLTMRLRAHGRASLRRVVLKAIADASNARKVRARARRGHSRVVKIAANRAIRRLSPTG